MTLLLILAEHGRCGPTNRCAYATVLRLSVAVAVCLLRNEKYSNGNISPIVMNGDGREFQLSTAYRKSLATLLQRNRLADIANFPGTTAHQVGGRFGASVLLCVRNGKALVGVYKRVVRWGRVTGK